MHTINITHNPFTVQTEFLINGQEPHGSSKISKHTESRLQRWVEGLFDDLSEQFNGDNHFKVIFKGLESDFLDIQEAADEANKSGMDIQLDWEKAQPAEQRLLRIRELIDEAKQHPKFAEFIDKNDEVGRSLEEAFNRDFDVYVVATMSSGKSTLINAMLGQDLLPAANEATTATIARITDSDSMSGRFSAKRYNHDHSFVGEEHDISQEVMKEWNKLSDTKAIHIEGDILAIKERPEVRLVLTDTPGPNNSQNEDHQRTTMSFIQDSRRNPLILYVLNAQQLGINDDSVLLDLVAEEMNKGGKQSKDRFIFVVNKMDVFDPENGESIPPVLKRVEKYLIGKGIQNPAVYPVSANLTRLIRKPSDKHTRSERGEHKKLADLFDEEPSMNLLQYMPVTSRVKRALDEQDYSKLMLASGLPAVEAMIDEYIDKYNLPHRLSRACQAMRQAIKAGLHEIDMIKNLKQDEHSLKELKDEIHALKERQSKGEDSAAYKDRLEREGVVLPKEIECVLDEMRSGAKEKIRSFTKNLSSKEVSIEAAERRLAEAEEDLRSYQNKVINQYESVFKETQELIREELKDEYQNYIASIFDGVAALNLPVLEDIKRSIADIPFNVSVDGDAKEKEEVVGERSISKWWNPFSWGSKVKVYETREYVDIGEAWSKRVGPINKHFDGLVSDARQEIDTGKDKLVDQFLKFMSREFDVKFSELMAALEEKMADQEALELAIADARKLQAWIEGFEAKLDHVLVV